MQRGKFLICLLAVAAAAIGLATSANVALSASTPVIVQPDNIKWEPVSGMTGLQSAVLWGDPTATGGQYALRYKAPDGFKFPPHSHPQIEQVTVLSGTFMVGVGTTVDASKMLALPAGTYVEIPAGLPHYGQAKGETILEVHGIGPSVFNMSK
jgi:hypothetical protein